MTDTGLSISVIICAYNAAGCIEAALRSLLAQSFTNFEIILADDASQDDTVSRAAAVLRHSPIPYRVLTNRINLGVGANKNFAAVAARGRIMAFMDADAAAPPNWLDCGRRYADRADLWGGPFRDQLVGRFNEATYAMQGFGSQEKYGGKDEAITLPGTNLFLTRAAFQQLGGFSSLAAGEDLDLVLRAQAQGLKALFVPELWVFHPWNFTPRAYFRRALAFKTKKRGWASERKKAAWLAGGVLGFLLVAFYTGLTMSLLLAGGGAMGLYGGLIVRYWRAGQPFSLAASSAAIRVVIMALAGLAYFNLLSWQRYWK
jgi:glycosyltransferase involved in cell wall biosynthesis